MAINLNAIDVPVFDYSLRDFRVPFIIHGDNEQLRFHAVTQFEVSIPTEVTSHVTHEGVQVSDHWRKKNTVISMEAVISNSNRGGVGTHQGFIAGDAVDSWTAISSHIADNLPSDSKIKRNAENYLSDLLSIFHAGELIELYIPDTPSLDGLKIGSAQTPGATGQFKGVLKSVTWRRDAETTDAFRVNLQFEEIRMASAVELQGTDISVDPQHSEQVSGNIVMGGKEITDNTLETKYNERLGEVTNFLGV